MSRTATREDVNDYLENHICGIDEAVAAVGFRGTGGVPDTPFGIEPKTLRQDAMIYPAGSPARAVMLERASVVEFLRAFLTPETDHQTSQALDLAATRILHGDHVK